MRNKGIALKKLTDTPPTGLSAAAKRWWRELVEEFEIKDAAGRQVLELYCRRFDRARECRIQIKREGATIRDRWGQVKPHPLLATERDAIAGMLAALRALNLDLEPLHDRPGRPGKVE